MSELESEIREQVRAARLSLTQARAADDDYLVAIHQSELDALLRTATDHGVAVDEAVVVDLRPHDVDEARAS